MADLVIEDIIFIISFLLFSIAIGIVGYRLLAGFNWFRSFYNAAVILSGTGVPDEAPTIGGKTFIAFYSLYGGLVFLIIFAIVIGKITSNTNGV